MAKVKASTMVAVMAGASCLLMGALMGFYGKAAKMKKQIEELVIASKHISTEHDAALLSMKMQALNLQLLADVHEALQEQNDRGSVMGREWQKGIAQASKDQAEIAGLLRQLVGHLVPTPQGEPAQSVPVDEHDRETNAFSSQLAALYTAQQLDEFYKRCCVVVDKARTRVGTIGTSDFDPYAQMATILSGGKTLSGGKPFLVRRDQAKYWFLREQIKRGDILPPQADTDETES